MENSLNASNWNNTKRRRCRGDITPNACTECRKKRSKCNGQKPCRRCSGLGVECIYEILVRHTKEEMRYEIEELRLKEIRLLKLITILISDGCSKPFLEQLRNGESAAMVAETLNKMPQNSVNLWADLNDSQRRNTQSDYLKSLSMNAQNLQPAQGKIHNKSHGDHPSIKESNHQSLENTTDWTAVTSDRSWIDHLLQLYFCWEYPIFSPLSKDQFLDDFQTGSTAYCSSLLVNSILAVGCRFSDEPRARTDPDDTNTAGYQFFSEAIKILELEENRCCLTTIQSLNFLSLWEASCGRSNASIFYSDQSMRLAVEMGLHKDVDLKSNKILGSTEQEIKLATFWGSFSLDQAWSLIVGRIPNFYESTNSVKRPTHTKIDNNSPWIPYIEDGAPECEITGVEPSNRWDVFTSSCRLSEVVRKSSHILYAPSNMLSSNKLLACYTDYMRWYDTIPAISRFGQDFTPAVLFSHIYYHFAILILFRPFIKLVIVNSAVSPRLVCSQASEAISSLLIIFSKLFTLRRVPVLMPYIALMSIITQLVIYEHSGTGLDSLRLGFSSMREMSAGHGFAVYGLHIILSLRENWGITADFDIDESSEIETRRPESLVYSQVIHEKFCRAVSTNINNFCPHTKIIDMADDTSSVSFHKGPIFSPLPLQGRPSIDTSVEKIEKLGFQILNPGLD